MKQTDKTRTLATARFAASLILLAVTVLAAGAPATAATVEAFAGPPTAPDTTRTDTFAQAGFGFYAPASGTKQINRLGFWVSPADSGNTGVLAIDHDVALYNYNGANYTQIASTTVPAGSTADANGYAWASIPPLTLTDTRQGADYYVVTAEVGTDVWAPNTGSAHAPTLDATFGTRTNNGWFSAAPAPGIGGTASLIHPANGGYFGPNTGLEGSTGLVRPVSARASSELTAGHHRRAANAVDGLGHATSSTNDWPGNPGGLWLSANGDTTPTITFDLGGVHALDALTVYNYNEAGALTSRGVQQADLSVSTDNVTYTPAGTLSLAKATGNQSNPGQRTDLAGLQARYVRLDVTSNYGDSGYTGLNEVEFYGTAQEAMPISPVTATATSELNSGNPNGGFHRVPGHLVDGTGLFAGAHTVVPEASMWLSAGLGFAGTPGDDGDPEVVFDLGGPVNLESARVWNYNEAGNFTGRGVNEMEILVSADGASYTSLGVFSLAQAPGTDNVDFSELLALGASNVQFVKFDILSNHNGVQFPATGGADNAFVGLSEVQFFAQPEDVPEPATIALLSLAIGGLGLKIRRRRRN